MTNIEYANTLVFELTLLRFHNKQMIDRFKADPQRITGEEWLRYFQQVERFELLADQSERLFISLLNGEIKPFDDIANSLAYLAEDNQLTLSPGSREC
jgi:hypothetical protein